MAHSHDHEQYEQIGWKTFLPAGISLVLLFTGLISDYIYPVSIFEGRIRLFWYIIAYLPVGLPVVKEALSLFFQKDFFNELSLMSIATLGAFAIGEYPEAVAVMLFYSIGELFQSSAVNKAKKSIKALLDIRPDSATVFRNNTYTVVSPEGIAVGEKIRVKPGERVPLDGVLLSSQSSFNTSALTGESKPKRINRGETVLAGMINLDHVIELQVEKIYSDSSLAKILELVQQASSRKAKTEQFIRRFARVYTPLVFLLALALTVFPYFMVSDYVFNDWFYRSLVFLVISCPCALVVSIPLGYFGGIGAASKHGILFKGANYLDLMNHVNTVVMDKTGTLTHGVFEVKQIHSVSGDHAALLAMAAGIEHYSNHPIAKAIINYANASEPLPKVENVTEIPGFGLEGQLDGKLLLAGNRKLLEKHAVAYDPATENIKDTIVLVAHDGDYMGYITIADKEKEDAEKAILEMKQLGVRNIVMLSGDKSSITLELAEKLGITTAYGDLLPEEKVFHLEQLKSNEKNCVAFVGDGINDAPSLALSDVGIAMGGMGSDAAIEVADVIIQTDQPSKIATAIHIAKFTRTIVVQNIILTLTIKLLVLGLGATGFATMWGAVFADVGVALLAILNAVRILGKKF